MTTADFNPKDFTQKRLKVTFRRPAWPVPDPATPYVMAEAEDGSGVTVAIFGPDSPAARADAARMVAQWNAALAITAPRATAQRIVDTLQARASGLLPQDFDEQLAADVDEMHARYRALRADRGFSEADRVAKVEFVERLLSTL